MNKSIYPGNELDLFFHASNWKSYFSRHISPFINGCVLEVGAGIGGTTQILSSNEHESWTCLEPDQKLAEELSQVVGINNSHSKFKIVVGNIADIDKSSSFDTILYIDVLEHIEDDRYELKQAADLLSDTGVLIILSPAYQWLYNEFDQSVGHYRRYNKRTLRASVPVELESLCVKYLDSVGVLASFVNSILLHKATPSINQILFWDRVMIPFSKILDPAVFYSFGKSLFGIWKKKPMLLKRDLL